MVRPRTKKGGVASSSYTLDDLVMMRFAIETVDNIIKDIKTSIHAQEAANRADLRYRLTKDVNKFEENFRSSSSSSSVPVQEEDERDSIMILYDMSRALLNHQICAILLGDDLLKEDAKAVMRYTSKAVRNAETDTTRYRFLIYTESACRQDIRSGEDEDFRTMFESQSHLLSPEHVKTLLTQSFSERHM